MVKNPPVGCRRRKRRRFDPWVRKISGSGRSPGEGNGNPLQYSCLKKPIEKPGRPQHKRWQRVLSACSHESALPLTPASAYSNP